MNIDSAEPLSPTRPLRIAALVKQIPEVESLTLSPDGRLERSGVALQMNDYCRRAVAQGRALARMSGGSLTVITLGPASAEQVLREAIAFGADNGVLVTDPAFAGSDSLATARALAAALGQTGPFDLVLTGRNSVDAETGQVPPQVATLLDLPFVAGVRSLRIIAETLHLGVEHDDEWINAEVDLPAVLSCAERLCDPCKVKDPAIWANVDRQRIRCINADQVGSGPWGQQGSPTSVGVVHQVASPREARIISASTVAEQVSSIMTVLADRTALERGPETYDGNHLPVAGADGGPEIVVAVEPSRLGLTSELVGAAAELAAKIAGRVTAFGPSLSLTQLGACGADDGVRVEGASADEDVALALVEHCQRRQPWLVLGPSTSWGREVLGRASAMLGAGMIGDAVELKLRDGRLVADKPAFGGLLVAEIHCSSPLQLATVRAGVLPRPASTRPTTAIPVTTVYVKPRGRVRVIGRQRLDDIDDLATAERVIGVGAGVDPRDYARLRSLADQIGAALAATRKVTDGGLLPRARQVGITGHSIAPRLFISVGSSGKFNHTVGLRNAGTIVAVNTDPAAPIFSVSDIGVVADWRDLLPELASAIAAAHQRVPGVRRVTATHLGSANPRRK